MLQILAEPFHGLELSRSFRLIQPPQKGWPRLTGRLFNYGTLTVRGFGGSQEFVNRLSSPEHVRELIQEQQSLVRPLARAWRRVAAG